MTKRVRVTSGVTQTKRVIIIIIIYANSVNCDLSLSRVIHRHLLSLQ